MDLPRQPRGGTAVAGEDGEVADAQVLQLVNDVVRLRPNLVSCPDRPGNRPVHRHEQYGLPGSSKVSSASLDLVGDGDLLIANQPEVADQDVARSPPQGTSP